MAPSWSLQVHAEYGYNVPHIYSLLCGFIFAVNVFGGHKTSVDIRQRLVTKHVHAGIDSDSERRRTFSVTIGSVVVTGTTPIQLHPSLYHSIMMIIACQFFDSCFIGFNGTTSKCAVNIMLSRAIAMLISLAVLDQNCSIMILITMMVPAILLIRLRWTHTCPCLILK